MTESQRRLIHRIYDALNRRDLAELRRLSGDRPEFEWSSAGDEIDAGTRRGTDETMAYFDDLFDVFDEMRTTIDEEIDLGADQAIFVVHHGVRGAASGAWADRREAHLWTFDGDAIASLREFPTAEEARKAAGEEARPA